MPITKVRPIHDWVAAERGALLDQIWLAKEFCFGPETVGKNARYASVEQGQQTCASA